MAASLGDSWERFSVRLPMHPILPDPSKQQYIDEYMEVGKKDKEAGQLTRFIVAKDVAFDVEITLKAGFQHGYYDGVMIKFLGIHSGAVFWQKRYPKSYAKEPSQKGQKIPIGFLNAAITEGRLMSKVRMELVHLVKGMFCTIILLMSFILMS